MANQVGRYQGGQFGNYRLVKLLGEGGFAEVYLGEHIHLGTFAAIKVLHTQLAHDDVDKFRTEARTIARLIHPNIVRVLEFGIVGKTPFLAMDYAPNGTLRQRHPRGIPLPLPTVLSYVKQIADALQCAHDEKLIHRDIKPENMLLGRRNEVLLSDFGIALVAQSSRYQSTQDITGTISYMAPEQIQGKSRSASDQYSLGIVVYEWLSGERPFHGGFTEIVAQHLAIQPIPLRQKNPKLPPAVEQAVMITLEKDPHNRFGIIQAFATASEQANQIKALTVVKPTSSIVQEPAVTSETPIVVKPTSPVVQVPPITPMKTPSPVQSSAKPEPLIISQELSWRHTHTLTGHEDSVFSVAISPDGQTLASGSADNTIKLWNLKTGDLLLTLTGHEYGVYSVAISPDGQMIASGSGDKTIKLWNLKTGQLLHTLVGHSGYVFCVAISPDGQTIASGINDKTIKLWGSK